MYKSIPLLFALILPTAAAEPQTVYEGTWVTTNRKLDGAMTCVVTEIGEQRWRGHFHGVWQGVQFSYAVTFSGPPERLRGTAQIDGADYEWTGAMSRTHPGWLKGSFTGNRYIGSFDLKRKSR